MRKPVSDCLEEGREGVYLDIIVSPNSTENKIKGIDQWRDRLKIYVTEKAEDGKANSSVIKLISKEFQIPPTKVAIVQGRRTNKKRVYMDIDKGGLVRILKDILEGK
ncbi:MAG: DUF167 domain-containing protein [Thermoplasmatota archaeon]